MDRPYVRLLRLQSYGCLQDATFRFTPLHALIGPNDSGKSTVLRALKMVALHLIGTGDPDSAPLMRKGSVVTVDGWKLGDAPESSVVAALRGTELLRFDPDFLRVPCPLIPDGQPLRFADEHGKGLPALYDALLIRDLPAYIALSKQFVHLFPTVDAIQLANPSQGTKAIGVRLTDGTVVPAKLMSEGMLYYLAFAVLPYLDPTPRTASTPPASPR
jgi:hypothetical protein